METLWFMIVAVMVAAYVVLDGFDLGAGVIYLAAARNPVNAAPLCAPSAPCGTAMRSGCSPPGHALFRLPPALCLELQRLLSAPDDGAVAADAARHRHRISDRIWKIRCGGDSSM